jgi:hypothetical protein
MLSGISTLLNSVGIMIFAVAQDITLAIRDAESGNPLAGVTVAVAGTPIGGVSDRDGNATLSNLPKCKVNLIFQHVGYRSKEVQLDWPL